MRWQDNKYKITWNVGDIHTDSLEMSGKMLSAQICYGNDKNGDVFIERRIHVPTLRTIPNNTHATASSFYPNSIAPDFGIRKLYKVVFDGIISLYSKNDCFDFVTEVFVSTDKTIYFEKTTVTNISDTAKSFKINAVSEVSYQRGTKGAYVFEAGCEKAEVMLKSGEKTVVVFHIGAKKLLDKKIEYDTDDELAKRRSFCDDIFNNRLVLKTGNNVLDTEFAFAKLRAAESVFQTESGLLHSPGGGAYYAAVWANDQAEYAGPFFPFLGLKDQNDASVNAYNLFRAFMSPEYEKIPSSVIAEGLDIWEGAGDRGDSSMYLYGASRFLLAYGDKSLCEEYFGSLCWCAEYAKRMLNESGVVKSDSDELEGRFPSGSANLCTNSLCYAGLVSAADVARELGKEKEERSLRDAAAELKANIEKYFSKQVSGYETYCYYEGNDVLRSWICIPLTMGIYEHSQGTVDALLSERLFCENGLVCVEGDKTFWDRSTLYALRGIFNAGYPDRVYDFLKMYTEKRLLSDHVPYPVEAYPEGNQRHLSAESALFARVITEGMFGIVPKGLNSVEIRPSLPSQIPSATLENAYICGKKTTLQIINGDCYTVKLGSQTATVQKGKAICLTF